MILPCNGAGTNCILTYLCKNRAISTAVLPDVLHLRVQFFESSKRLSRYLASQLDVGVLGHEESDDEVLGVGEVDEVVIVVEVDHCQLVVSLCLDNPTATFCRLPLVWLSALMRRVVVWMNF